ncbi:MAG: efflux RND transporter permease subunit, partial [Myxococcota bacterium]
GIVGAVVGHALMGYALSMMSMMGIVALSGIVVNDSLLLVVSVNRLREAGVPLREAVVSGSAIRFRAILLTSLTTFFGLAPMILETSVQARFLVPMALSLGFGVLFATFITLLIVPAGYMATEDLRRFWIWTWGEHDDEHEEDTPKVDISADNLTLSEVRQMTSSGNWPQVK